MANFQITNVRIRIKQDTSTNWNSSTLIPLGGEMCLATDTGELRYGDGAHPWTGLSSIGKISKPTGTNGILSVNGVNITIYELPIATNSNLGGVKSSSEILVNSTTGEATLSTSGVTANAGENDDLYFAFKTDAKGRVVEGLEETDVIASDKNTDTNTDNQYSSTLGLVKSDFDEFLALNADKNKGKVVIDENGNMSVIRVDESDKFHTACTINFDAQAANNTNPGNPIPAIPTDVTGTFSFDGSQDVTTQLTLVNTTRTDAAANNTATEVITGITSDTKGRITATSRMNAVSAYTGSTDEGKLVKLGTDGKIDTNLVTSGADLVTNNKINAELLTDEITGVDASGSYVPATGTYIPGVVYYTDSTGQTIVNTSNFVSGETDVSSYYVAQNSTNTEVDMNSTVVTTSENSITNIEYSQSYVLSSVNI